MLLPYDAPATRIPTGTQSQCIAPQASAAHGAGDTRDPLQGFKAATQDAPLPAIRFACLPIRQHEELKMNQQYYDAVTKMEKMGVDPEYIQGWQGGYLLNPEREEQRVTEAYSAGYEDGKEKNTENFSNWVK
jgi:hypothetical protein